jgi:hypothetical protein
MHTQRYLFVISALVFVATAAGLGADSWLTHTRARAQPLTAAPAPLTAAVDFVGNWTLKGDYTLNGVLEPVGPRPGTEVYTVQFVANPDGSWSGHYTDLVNPSQFNLQQFTTGRGSVIGITQLGGTYAASYSAHVVSSNEVRGAWTDLDGNAGDFVLQRALGGSGGTGGSGTAGDGGGGAAGRIGHPRCAPGDSWQCSDEGPRGAKICGCEPDPTGPQ